MSSETDAKLDIADGCAICKEAIFKGNVKIGAGTVIHPRALISAEDGPIEIGENNLIEENVEIVNKRREPLKIGNCNIFEVGCQMKGKSVGDNNIFESKSAVGQNVGISNGCVIGAMCQLESEELIPDNTIIFGKSCQRRINIEKPAVKFNKFLIIVDAL